ncbi:MAG: hypothetical protein OFPII_00680 [Osedax symbiont Rs1]|nr:MAG: hypothetical protein OFPII_00680 [Osedax symbiont Rs1]
MSDYGPTSAILPRSEAAFTGVTEHIEPVFNAVLPSAVIIPSG